MQGTPASKKRDYSGRVYRPRQCADCPVIFQPGSSGQKRCESCQRERTLRLKREDEKRRNDAKREPHHCADCGAELPVYQGMHSKRCEPCRERYWKNFAREKQAGYVADGRNRQWQHRYFSANRERVNERTRLFKRAHPEQDAAALHRRRMRIEAGKLDATERLLSRLYRQAIKRDPCFYCGTLDTQCVDHYFAIAKGGSDRWFNLVRACRKCNLSKRTMCGTAFLLLTGG